MSEALRAFELRGPAATDALDWLHVHAEVAGAIETDDAITVWLAGALPIPPFAGVVVREIEVPGALLHATGLENDGPVWVAADLLVRPPWVARPSGFTGIELVVPRGNAFGSGEHASTQATLRCLHGGWDAPASLADVGTGSGILALYASVRGCGRIEACDVETAAVAATRELVPGARVHLGGPEHLSPCDCVVANMTATELTSAMPAILNCWTRRGALVLGGMRAHEVAAIERIVPALRRAAEVAGDFTAVSFR